MLDLLFFVMVVGSSAWLYKLIPRARAELLADQERAKKLEAALSHAREVRATLPFPEPEPPRGSLPLSDPKGLVLTTVGIIGMTRGGEPVPLTHPVTVAPPRHVDDAVGSQDSRCS